MNNNFNQTKNINHRHHNHHLSHSSCIITTTRSNSTTQACAACRYQRRKCAPDCILAPYFPHDRQRQFQNAHKLFGVSNITKIIRDLDPQQKNEAMRTIIYQSDVRAQDPVGGCYRIIRELQCQIEFSRAELDFVLHQLAICRAHAIQYQNQNQNHQIVIDGVAIDDPNLYDDPSTVLDNNNINNNNDDNINFEHHGLDLDLGQIPQQDHDNSQYILGEHDLNDQNDGCQDDHVLQLQEINSWASVGNSPPSSAVCMEQKLQVDGCEDFKLINEIPTEERLEFKFKFNEINEPSDETLVNEENHKASTKEENVTFFTKEENVSSYQQHNEDHDLKSAATLFTLTNCSTY